MAQSGREGEYAGRACLKRISRLRLSGFWHDLKTVSQTLLLDACSAALSKWQKAFSHFDHMRSSKCLYLQWFCALQILVL